MNFRPRTKSNLCKVTRFQITLGVKSLPFKIHGKEYIVVVDFYSDFIEVKQLQENSSSSMIKYLTLDMPWADLIGPSINT